MSTGIRSKGKDRYEIRLSANGQPISRMFKGTKKEAERERRRLLREAEAGRFDHQDKTLERLLEDWMALAKRKHSPTTVRTYRSYIDNRIVPALGAIPLHRLSTADLDTFYMALEDDGMAPRSVHQCHSIIRRALRQGEIWKWVHENPARLVTLPRIPEGEIHPPTVTQVHALIAKAEESDPLMAALIFVASDTGARRGELCALRWTDLDPIKGTLSIARAVVSVDGLHEKDTKSHQRRLVALWSTTMEALARYRQDVLQAARLSRVDVAADAFIFSREPDGSEALDPDEVTACFRVIRKQAKVNVRFHDLRHFVGTELVARGVPLPAVSRRLGHRLVSTTANIYAHSTDESDRQAAEVIGSLMSPDAKSHRPLPPAGRKKAEDGDGEG